MRNLRYFQTVPISQKNNKHHLSPFFLPLGFGTFNNWQKVLKKIWIFQMFPSNLCFCTSSFTIFLKFYCFLPPPPPVFLRFFLTFSVSSGPTPLPPHFSFGQTKRTWGISRRSLIQFCVFHFHYYTTMAATTTNTSATTSATTTPAPTTTHTTI